MDALIKRVLDDIDYGNNPYIVALRDGRFDKEDFIETQIQFYFAVIFFSRPMAAVAAKIPDVRLRLEVLRNVWEEHGEGGDELQHGESFEILLQRLGDISKSDIGHRVLWPEVRMFNTLLTGACVMDEHVVGVGVMGIIEHMFSDISYWLGEGIIERGWLSREQMIHYSLHQELDIKHAADFFDVLRPRWDEDPANQYYVEQGLRLGACAFNSLYEGLYRARKRRWNRELLIPHSRT